VEKSKIALPPKRAVNRVNRIIRTADVVRESPQRFQPDWFIEILQAVVNLWPVAQQGLGGKFATSYNTYKSVKDIMGG
jgi:hypothetical protein